MVQHLPSLSNFITILIITIGCPHQRWEFYREFDIYKKWYMKIGCIEHSNQMK
jgi:hypothetical protein